LYESLIIVDFLAGELLLFMVFEDNTILACSWVLTPPDMMLKTPLQTTADPSHCGEEDGQERQMKDRGVRKQHIFVFGNGTLQCGHDVVARTCCGNAKPLHLSFSEARLGISPSISRFILFSWTNRIACDS
jgi:hypothetical protein